MEKIILFQCWDDKSKFIQFLMDVVISEPNAGKNYIMDTILHYYFNFGLVGNFNRYSTFPLMECVDKRILMWNEPSCELASFETLKMLFSGDNCNVKVKYENDTILSRTPIIILSNNDPFPKDEVFRSRMIYYKWSCPMLRDYKKKILPLAFYYLLEMHDIFNSVDNYLINETVVNDIMIEDFNVNDNLCNFSLDDKGFSN
ncbi:hypothetical protein FQA39_LY09820 [Lamprigera yunnana]|nr:hypothetical protein FQA39_LY09820 [Lamprigera yunnana]